MELDPITKWLIRISSSIIIALGLTLFIATPLLAIKANAIFSLIQLSIKSNLKDLLTALLANI